MAKVEAEILDDKMLSVTHELSLRIWVNGKKYNFIVSVFLQRDGNPIIRWRTPAFSSIVDSGSINKVSSLIHESVIKYLGNKQTGQYSDEEYYHFNVSK